MDDLRIRELGLTGRSDLSHLRLYTSEQGHSSIDKAALALGLGLESVRRVEVGDEYRMLPRALADAIAEDRRGGVRPFCVVATVGSTSCTSIDAARIREHLRLAQKFAERIDNHPEFERLAPLPLSTVCFRARPAGVDDEESLDGLNERLLDAINRSGDAFLSHTKLRGRFTIRFVISHLRTNQEQIDRVWNIAEERLRFLIQND